MICNSEDRVLVSSLCCSEGAESLNDIASSQSISEDCGGECEAVLETDVCSEVDIENRKAVLHQMRTQEVAFMPKYHQLCQLFSERNAQRQNAIMCMMDINKKMNFTDSTFFASVNIFDRFLSMYTLQNTEEWVLPLITVASVSIAAKMGEVYVPSLGELQACIPSTIPFDIQHIMRMEVVILNFLKWKVASVTSCTLLPYIIAAIPLEATAKDRNVVYRVAVNLLKKFVEKLEYAEYRPSELASAATLLAIRNVDLSPVQYLKCEAFVLNFFGESRKRKLDGVCRLVRECMSQMEDFEQSDECCAGKRVKRSLSPCTPLSAYDQ